MIDGGPPGQHPLAIDPVIVQQRLRFGQPAPPFGTLLAIGQVRFDGPPHGLGKWPGFQHGGPGEMQMPVTGCGCHQFAQIGKQRGYRFAQGCIFLNRQGERRGIARDNGPFAQVQMHRVKAQPVVIPRLATFAKHAQGGAGQGGRWCLFDGEGAGQPVLQPRPVVNAGTPKYASEGRQREIEGRVAQDLAWPEQAGNKQGQKHEPC